jgi:(5-formylfuran-3-yl)methyl phosphate transaminase
MHRQGCRESVGFTVECDFAFHGELALTKDLNTANNDGPSPAESISKRAAEMPPFLAMEVLEKASAMERDGRSVIHLEVGEPDFDTPSAAVETGIKALRDGRTHYTHSLGHPELREAIAGWQKRQYGIDVSPDRVVVTMGSSGAMLLAFAAMLDPGSQVILTDPHYACYPNFITTFGGVPVRTPVREEDGFQYDPDVVRTSITDRTRSLVLNSPANPTGTLTTPERMRELVAVVEGSATIVSDEVYHGLVYKGRANSILEFTDRAVVVNGFSKLFAMTGWRLGYAIVPEYLVRPMQKLQQNLFISPPDYPQFAAIAALEESSDDVANMVTEYDKRRQLVLRRLAEMGLSVLTEPIGAFYVFVNVAQYTSDVYKFAFEVLEQTGVAMTPGIDFGPGGEGYIRISYANSIEKIEEAMRRLAEYFPSLSPVEK